MTDTAIVVQRVEPNGEADTSEIEVLAESAGYNVVDVLTQSREEDREYNIGEGKVHEINHSVTDNDADTVIIDNEMDPYQIYNLGVYLPTDVDVRDRYTLILDIFDMRATTRKSQLQVELARLRYELPRAETKIHLAQREEHPGFMGLGEYDDSRESDIKDQIKRIKNELNQIENRNSQRREKRREEGFDLVAIAGYTNAGKSTLFRQLADGHEVNENEGLHNDLHPTAETTDDYFTTLDTITRQMDFKRRDVLITDTVGFIDKSPHWLVDAFTATFDSIYRADLVLLVVDITKPIGEIQRRIATCHDTISRYDACRIVTVFNKCDAVSDEEQIEKSEGLAALAPNPVCVSAQGGDGIKELKQRIHHILPPFEQDVLQLPLRPATMSLISWVHENAYVNNCDFTGESVFVDYQARESVIQKAHSKAVNIQKIEDEA